MQVTEMRVLETNRRERDGVRISRSNGQTGNQQIMPAVDYLEVFKKLLADSIGRDANAGMSKRCHISRGS